MTMLLTLILYATWLYMLIVIARALLSWVNPDPYNPIVKFLRRATDPALYFIRRNIPLPRTAIDVSPLILLLGLTLAAVFITATLHDPRLVSIPRNLLYAIIVVAREILTIYMYIVIIRVILSWVNPDPYNFLVRAVCEITEPVLYRVRRLLPVAAGGFDFSPLIVIFLIYAINKFLGSIPL